jgi:MoxR-like ATPase
MTYVPLFDPDGAGVPRPADMVPYVYDPDLVLAVNVALATDRPLLLSGTPGCGKSSLARDVAWRLGFRYEQHVVTSRIQAQDLKWRFDAVRRLSDALRRDTPGGGRELNDRVYVEPGVLWRAFDPWNAMGHGKQRPNRAPPPGAAGVAVLIDEIDKADPDVPNDLLVVLDERWFAVDDIDEVVRAPADLRLFMVITTNGERDLPSAFVRRCVDYRIETPDIGWMKKIARAHHPDVAQGLLDRLGDTMEEMTKRASAEKRRGPSTAEFLDALRALQKLKIDDPGSTIWRQVTEATLWKTGHERGPA